MMLSWKHWAPLFLVGAVAHNRTESCEDTDKEAMSWLQTRQGQKVMSSSSACDCVYTIQSGDSCWAISKDYFGVEYKDIQVMSTGETCPDAALYVGDQVCVTGATKGKEKCEGGSPDCVYIVQSGDSCWAMSKEIFDVPYESITNMQTGEKCPNCAVNVGDQMQIDNPQKGQDKCEGPTPTFPPSPGRCEWPENFQTELYWMPYTEKDALPSADILKRVTKVIMAFVGTYAYTKESQWQEYKCESSCTFPKVWPLVSKGQEWAKQMKAMNSNLEVTISFGGWNQGPGDQNLDCYEISGCYADVNGLADELAQLNGGSIDGIDLDYEMSEDLSSGQGVTFLGLLSKALQDRGVHVSQAPQPPYFDTSGPGGGSYTKLLQEYPGCKKDLMAIQYYNNLKFAIGLDDDNIAKNYWSAVDDMGGDASKVLLGLCFVDCNDGFRAYDPSFPAKSQTLAPNLLQNVMSKGKGFGGIMIWANPQSKKSSKCKDASGQDDGCFPQMPAWLDTVCYSVGGTPAPTPPPPPVPEDGYNGQFMIPAQWGSASWKYKGPKGPIGICFGGASVIQLNTDAGCAPGGDTYQVTVDMLTKGGQKFYDFGGGDDNAKQWYTEDLLAKLNDYMDTLVGSYEGIFYDIETFPKDFNPTTMKSALDLSFSMAKSKGFNIIASTSYTSPYTPRGYPSDYQQRADEVWKHVMANPDIDIFAPQFYKNGKTADIRETGGSSVKFTTWTSTIQDSSGRIRPVLKAYSWQYYENQVAQMEQKCKSIPEEFCQGGYLLWGGP